ncbi:hypothetical protein ACG9ZE_23115, partial [Acinetobacter sp. ULE_I053]|uniref:hypothetical protein n=1 Tax=Acinetobacter sp. ULE_I053 TaxID=3373069 RepID=UPI003AF46695
ESSFGLTRKRHNCKNFDFSVVPFSGVSGVNPLTQPQKGHFRAKREKSPLCVLAYNLKIA